jgi:hypothetical protein
MVELTAQHGQERRPRALPTPLLTASPTGVHEAVPHVWNHTSPSNSPVFIASLSYLPASILS